VSGTVRVAICIPAYGPTAAKFTHSLANMIIHTLSARLEGRDGEAVKPELATFIVSCSMLTESRHRLVAEALAWEADYLLWLDADHIFPADALARLWAHGLAIVGCNYARRARPTAPTAAKGERLVFTTKAKAEAGDVEEVDHLGFGLCLIDMKVFDALQAGAEARGETSFLPLFQFGLKENGVGVIGEDVFFFEKLRGAGVPVHCDHGLSWEVGHIHEEILTNAHAEVQRAKWDERWATRGEKFRAKADEIEAREAPG
jgi:hypothetical protein